MSICSWLWCAFLVIWMIWAIRTKPTQRREGIFSRLSYVLPTVGAFYLLFANHAVSSSEWLRARVFPDSFWTGALGVAVTAAGIGFAVWARVYLGGNWSSSVTVKVGHELVRTGPYRWVRHPIYTGMVLALLGTAIALNQVRGFVAVVLLYLGFKIKSKIEESAMQATFGPQYVEYSQQTGAILPRLGRRPS
jgi:protein-S-isoprenylcysteine O-methyltransferase Ste14